MRLTAFRIFKNHINSEAVDGGGKVGGKEAAAPPPGRSTKWAQTGTKSVQKVAPKSTQKLAQKVAPKSTQKLAQKVAPKSTQKLAQKVAPKPPPLEPRPTNVRKLIHDAKPRPTDPAP